MTATPMPRPVKPAEPGRRPLHTWSAPVAVVVTAIMPLHRHVTRQVRDVRVLAERDELPAGDLEDRAAPDALLDARAVAGRERLHLGVGAGDDDPRGILRLRRDAVGQIA